MLDMSLCPEQCVCCFGGVAVMDVLVCHGAVQMLMHVGFEMSA